MNQLLPSSSLLVAVMMACQSIASQIVVPDDYPSIGDALVASSTGDTIIVRAGVYVETIDFSGKNVTLESVGGPEVTIIDGDGLGSVVTFASSESAGAVLQGFTITGGSGHMTPFGWLAGGGIYCEASSPTIRGNIIRGNRAELGGGVYCRMPSEPILESNLISDNAAERPLGGASGGGIQIEEDCAALIRQNRIKSNSATFQGGGIGCDHVLDARIEGNVIRDNHAEARAGGVACTSRSVVAIIGNTVIGNSSESGPGAGIFSLGSTVSISRNRIEYNSRSFAGAGVFSERSSVVLDGNLIGWNTSSGHGGGAYVSESDALVANNVIHDNTVNCEPLRFPFDSGTGYPPFFNEGGGGLFFSACTSLSILNNTISRNSACYGGGVFVYAGTSQSTQKRSALPTIANTIVWGNSAPQLVCGHLEWNKIRPPHLVRFVPIPAIVTDCVIEDGWRQQGGVRILDVDPRFVNPDMADYRLRPESPCVDIGNRHVTGALPSSFDFELDERVVDGDLDGMERIDIGADELAPEAAARFGSVNARALGGLADLLLVNGSAGDRSRRVVRLSRLEPVRVEIFAPPAGPSPARFAIYAWSDEPDRTTVTVQPVHLGWTGFPTPLNPGEGNMPIVTWNNLGHEPRLGKPNQASTPAPSVLVEIRQAALLPGRITLQGFIQDAASGGEIPASVTNAVVIDVLRD